MAAISAFTSWPVGTGCAATSSRWIPIAERRAPHSQPRSSVSGRDPTITSLSMNDRRSVTPPSSSGSMACSSRSIAALRIGCVSPYSVSAEKAWPSAVRKITTGFMCCAPS